MTGLVQMCELNFGTFEFGKSKRSSEIALIIIHRMLTDYNYVHGRKAQDVFICLESSVISQMDLGKHSKNHINESYILKPPKSKDANASKAEYSKKNYALEIIQLVLKYKRSYKLSDLLKKEKYVEEIEKALE